ncbi:MAG: ChaN family lipoprotein [Myxococcota bacterium]|nr:ChaN family lipoprotein [Myxococcota bacterium]
MFGPGAVILIGELHGTVQIPAAVAALLEPLAHPIVLGIEWPSELQVAVDAYVAGAIDAAALVATPSTFWAWRDGRSSEAMVALLARMRQRDVRVVCFDGAFEDPAMRDAGMAERFTAAVDTRAVNVALCGNLHARMANPRWMGWNVRERFPHAIALDAVSAGGTAWCTTDERGPRAVTFRRDRAGTPGAITLFEAPDERGFTGEIFVGPIDASPPVST